MKSQHAVVVGLTLAALPVAGQESPLPDLFSEVVDVRVVNVEIVVTDRRGHRIRGLDASDFELLVDRKPVSIAYFTEIDDGYARSSVDDGIEASASPAADEQVGTNYLIFIDDLHAVGHHRNRVLRGLERDLGLLSPVDRVAVVVFDGSSVSSLLNWTDSGYRIMEALGRARGRKAHGRAKPFELGIRPDRIRRTVMAAATAIHNHARAPGRKVMLLLTQDWGRSNGLRATQASMENLYSPLVHAANRVGYSLYPIDLPGLRPKPRIVNPSYHDPIFWLYGPRWTPAHLGRYASPSYETAEHDILRYLARQTGARAMLDSYRDRALSETIADTRSYYWLGFEAPGTEDDQLHRIKVRLPDHSALRVRARKHYRATSRDTELSMRLESSLLLSDSPGDDTLQVTESPAESSQPTNCSPGEDVLEVCLGTPSKAGLGKVSVPMKVKIPLDTLTLLPTDGRWMNDLEFRVTMTNEQGRRSRIPVRKIPIRGSRAPKSGDYFIDETDLRVRNRHARYLAEVYDPLSDTTLSTSGPLATRIGPDTQTGGAR